MCRIFVNIFLIENKKGEYLLFMNLAIIESYDFRKNSLASYLDVLINLKTLY